MVNLRPRSANWHSFVIALKSEVPIGTLLNTIFKPITNPVVVVLWSPGSISQSDELLEYVLASSCAVGFIQNV